MVWLKAFHIVFVVSWFAGLLYLPRLFVYHAGSTDEPSRERFKVMERRLFGMMTIGATLTALLGLSLLIHTPALLHLSWLHIKFVFVAMLLCYHGWCYRLMIAFRRDDNRHSPRWYRWFNEAPSLLLIAIVVLAVVKPF